jgi:ribosome recycling factor
MDAQALIKQTEDAMHKSVEYLIHEYAGIRTGKASPQLVENIDVKVSIYGGTHMKLKQLAAISTPEARLLMVQPFDPATLQDLERAIREANIGINPATEGKSIRLPVPELTEERRRDMVKVVKHEAEEARIRIRSARRDGMEGAKKLEKDKLVNEDTRRDLEEKIQKLTDKYVHDVDDHAKRKEQEVMTV